MVVLTIRAKRQNSVSVLNISRPIVERECRRLRGCRGHPYVILAVEGHGPQLKLPSRRASSWRASKVFPLQPAEQRPSQPASHTRLVHACSDHTEGLSWSLLLSCLNLDMSL